MCKIFVYGTLKKDFHNHYVMEKAGGKFIGTDSIPAIMFEYTKSFPAIELSTDTNKQVHGEVYQVDSIAPLDRLEGYNPDRDSNNFYNRSLVKTQYGDAWVYHMEDLSLTSIPKIEDGVWK